MERVVFGAPFSDFQLAINYVMSSPGLLFSFASGPTKDLIGIDVIYFSFYIIALAISKLFCLIVDFHV